MRSLRKSRSRTTLPTRSVPTVQRRTFQMEELLPKERTSGKNLNNRPSVAGRNSMVTAAKLPRKNCSSTTQTLKSAPSTLSTTPHLALQRWTLTPWSQSLSQKEERRSSPMLLRDSQNMEGPSIILERMFPNSPNRSSPTRLILTLRRTSTTLRIPWLRTLAPIRIMRSSWLTLGMTRRGRRRRISKESHRRSLDFLRKTMQIL